MTEPDPSSLVALVYGAVARGVEPLRAEMAGLRAEVAGLRTEVGELRVATERLERLATARVDALTTTVDRVEAQGGIALDRLHALSAAAVEHSGQLMAVKLLTTEQLNGLLRRADATDARVRRIEDSRKS